MAYGKSNGHMTNNVTWLIAIYLFVSSDSFSVRRAV